MIKLLASLFALSSFAAPSFAAVDPTALEAELKGPGLTGWIHGRTQYAVFTYRVPGNFFDFYHFPLTSELPEVREVIDGLKRHDHIRVFGSYVDNGAPVKHIRATKVEVLKRWESGMDLPPYAHEAAVPGDLLDKKSFVGKVHAVADEGRVLVMEYRDAVIPFYTGTLAPLAKDLWRGDKIRIHHRVRLEPEKPPHLGFDPDVRQPLEVLSRIREIHGKPAELRGNLVVFKKSPEIIFDVYALQVTDADGITLDYTLVNFEDPAVFQKIREKLQAAWDAGAADAVAGRNCFVNPKLWVRAKGTLNEVAPTQANPQILLKSADDLVVETLR
jgi:hypothetical protein